MTNTILTKLIESVKWRNPDLHRTLTSAESACNTLLRRNIPIKDFFVAAMGENSYAVLLLMQRFLKTGQLEKNEYDECKELLISYCKEKMELLSTEEIEGNLYSERILNLALYMATVLILRQDDLIGQMMECVKGTCDTKEQIVEFSKNMFVLLRYAGDSTEFLVLLYLQFYLYFPIDWCEDVAYNQGMEIPIIEQLPETLKILIHQALQDHNMRYADLVLKVFVNVRLHQLDLTDRELMQIAMQVRGNNFFRGLLFTEKMIATDMESSIDALEKWWELIQTCKNKSNPEWLETQNWFEVYYLSRQIQYDPKRARCYIQKASVIPASTFTVHKTNEVIQRTLETLFMAKEKLVFEYLEKIDAHNVFRFQTDEKYYPYFDLNTNYNLEEAIENLCSLGYEPAEMIDIYMNTFLRSCYNLSLLMSKIFSNGQGLTIKGKYADISSYCSKYKMTAHVVVQNNTYSMLIHNVCYNQKTVFFTNTWWAEHKKYCEQAFVDQQKIYCYLTSLDLTTYSVSATPCMKEEDFVLARNISKDTFHSFLRSMEEIIEKKKPISHWK